MKQCNVMFKLLLAAIMAVPLSGQAQKATKVSQTIKTDKEVTIDLNTSFCNIEFDTWNKDVVEIEAYIEGEKLSKEELQEALKQWNVDIDATASHISISTGNGHDFNWDFRFDVDSDREAALAAINELKLEMADIEIPEINVVIPNMPMIPTMPDLPPLPEGMGDIRFDYEAYKKNGDKYMEEWSKQFESKFGKDYEKKMEEWGEKFGKEWSEKYAKEMEKWGDSFGKQMEAWGEQFESRMEASEARKLAREARDQAREAHALEREKHMIERQRLEEKRKEKIEKMTHTARNPNVKKTIKIKMPKNARLKLNVKHGELKLAGNVSNLKADLEHAKLSATSINGSATSINASYSPVYVANWDIGELNLNYSKDVRLQNVKHLVMSSNASNVLIDKLVSNAIVDGNFGIFKVAVIDAEFSGLNLILQNSEAQIVLPQTEFNLQYKGAQSFLKHPNNKKKEQLKQFSSGTMSSDKTIVLNAKFSDVVLQ